VLPSPDVNYFVTGATGFIGSNLVRQLAKAGHGVRALARSPEAAPTLEKHGIEVHRGDITDKESMRAAMLGVDGVFHVAGWYQLGGRDKRTAWEANVQGTRNVLELAADLGIPKIVYTSTLAVFSDTHGKLVDESYRYDGPHLTEYDRTKWLAHYEVAEPMMRAGLPLVIVQPGLVYGPGDAFLFHNMLVQYLHGRLLATPRGATYCWGHVVDAADAHVRAMERGEPGQSYIIAGPPHTVVDVMILAEQFTSIPRPRLVLGPGTLRAAAAVVGVLERFLPVPRTYGSETLRSMAGVTYMGSNAKATTELGLEMRPLAIGLNETLEYEMQR
jgi:nucleoside-diphosphate-sugar epimerase